VGIVGLREKEWRPTSMTLLLVHNSFSTATPQHEHWLTDNLYRTILNSGWTEDIPRPLKASWAQNLMGTDEVNLGPHIGTSRWTGNTHTEFKVLCILQLDHMEVPLAVNHRQTAAWDTDGILNDKPALWAMVRPQQDGRWRITQWPVEVSQEVT